MPVYKGISPTHSGIADSVRVGIYRKSKKNVRNTKTPTHGGIADAVRVRIYKKSKKNIRKTKEK